jgi:hypothetical protein
MAVSTAMSTNNQAQVATNEPLSVYIGHDPNEEVDGVMFANHPLVRGAVESAVPDPAIRHWILRQGTAAPISLRGGRLVSNVCEPHNCGPHNWTILIDPAGTSAEVCYAVNSTESAVHLVRRRQTARGAPGTLPDFLAYPARPDGIGRSFPAAPRSTGAPAAAGPAPQDLERIEPGGDPFRHRADLVRHPHLERRIVADTIGLDLVPEIFEAVRQRSRQGKVLIAP